MTQTSNGSITITDLTDITDVYLEYCMAADSITTAAVIIAKTIWTPPERGWSTEYPTWQSGYQIWIREVTKKEGIAQLEYGTPYLDKAVNQINNNISNIQTKIKKIWSDSTGSYMASGIGGNDVTESNVNTYGFNSKSTTTGISFNYNAIPLTTLGTDGLKLYSPVLTNSIITGNRLSVVLDNNGLQFSDSTNIPIAQFSTNMIQLGRNDTNSVVLDSDGLQFYDSNNIPIAQFNDTGITMGKSDGSQSYLFEDYHSLQMIDKEGETYFYINDLRNSNGIASESLRVDLLARDVFDIDDRHILSLRIYYCGELGFSEPVELTNILNITNYTVDGHLYKIELPSAPQSSFSLRINYTADWTQYETKTFNCDGNTRVFYIDETTRNNIYNWQALVDDEGWHCVYYKNETLTSISFYDEVSGYYEFQYTTDTPLKNYTFGIRQSTEKKGNYSVVEGYNNIASGDYSHAEGYNTTANINTFNPSRPKIAAHAEGYRTIAGGNASHAEGYRTTARGDESHAEGEGTEASGIYSHAEGKYTTASGESSHAEGSSTTASGKYSHAQNLDTEAYSEAQTAIGKYNITDRNNQYAFIIGNGTISTPSNAFTVDWQGRIACSNHSGILQSIFNIFYPVGSYYETSLPNAIPSGESTPTDTDLASLGTTWFNPEYAWGGEWELETEGQVHVSAGSNYAVSGALSNTSDGGEETHKLTTQEMPAHTHGSETLTGTFRTYQYSSWNTYTTGIVSQGTNAKNNVAPSTGSNNGGATFTVNATHEHNSVGGGQSHNNMQPYIVVYRWCRTA